MSFLKFKLENTPERSAPVPIAAAVSRTSSTSPHGHGQQNTSIPLLVPGPPHQKSRNIRSGTRNNGGPGPIDPRDLAGTVSHARIFGNKRKPAKSGRNTSCLECRTTKTRCDVTSTGPMDQCHRCLQLNKTCVFDLPRQQAAAQQSVGPRTYAQPLQQLSGMRPKNEPCKEVDKGPVSTLETTTSLTFWGPQRDHLCSPSRSAARQKQLDLKIDSLINRNVAEHIFYHFVSTFSPKCPIVLFLPGVTATHVRETKPVLFLSILGVASAGYCTISIQRELSAETMRCLTRRAVAEGEKSIELVQALQVASQWYRAPDDYTQMNLNQLANITVTMAIDLGLEKIEVLEPKKVDHHDWDQAESQRAWLGCFLLFSSLSLILRRPSLISWTAEMDKYLADLQRAETSFTDVFLCELVRTEKLCHAVARELSLGDRAAQVSTEDPRIQRAIENYQSQIDFWPISQLEPLQKSLIDFGRFAGSLYAHEIALHVNHNIDEFEAPFTAKSLKSCNFIDAGHSSPYHASMLRRVLVSSHGLLDAFLDIPLCDMLTLSPYVYGGRVIYAIILLLKMHKASAASAAAGSGFIRTDELRVAEYLTRLVVVAQALFERDERSALSRSFLVMGQLKGGFDMHENEPLPPVQRIEGVGESAALSSNEHPQAVLRAATEIATESMGMELDATQANQSSFHDERLGQSVQSLGPCDLPCDNERNDEWFWEDFFNVEMLG